MARHMIRLLVAAAGIALTAPGLAGTWAADAAGAVPGAARSPAALEAARPAAAPGTQLWVARYHEGKARSVAVSPDGTKVYVTGSTGDERSPYVTVAYDAATGAPLWVRSYWVNAGVEGGARAVAVSPDGTRVFVTGSNPAFDAPTAATVAYDAVTGAQLWAARYHGPFAGGTAGTGLAVSPDGKRLFVSGTQYTFGNGEGDTYYATVAYNAATGSQVWARLYNGTRNGGDHASAMAVSPGGSKVFLTGTSGAGYATVAYSASTGTRLWATRYIGPAGGDEPSSIALNPGGSRVFVTGYSPGGTSGADYATVAYSASTGSRLWVSRYNGPGNGDDAASSMAVSPGGGRKVFVTGYSYGGTTSNLDYATVAYNSLTGARLWVRRYNGPGNGKDSAASIAVAPDAGTVLVTGGSNGGTSLSDYATVAYQASTGTRQWVMRYNGPGNGKDYAGSIAVSPRGGAVFVTGSSRENRAYQYATVAYSS